MDLQGFRLADMEPMVTARECGGWLATAPRWAPLQIGTTGESEEDARERFHKAVTAWSATLEPFLAFQPPGEALQPRCVLAG